MHDMIVDNKRNNYENYVDPSEFCEGQSSSSSGPPVEPFQNYANHAVDISTYLANRNDTIN